MAEQWRKVSALTFGLHTSTHRSEVSKGLEVAWQGKAPTTDS